MKIKSFQIYIATLINAYVLCFQTNLYAEVYVYYANDHSLFFPVNCDDKGENCKESNQPIAYKKGIPDGNENNDNFWSPKAILVNPAQLPDSVKLLNNNFTWAPKKSTDEIVVQLHILDQATDSNSSKYISVTLKGYYDTKVNSKNDWQRTCDEELRAWSSIGVNNADTPEKPNPLPGVPSQVLAFENLFEQYSSEEINITNRLDNEQSVVSSVLFDEYDKLILAPIGAVKSPKLRRAVDGLVLQAPKQVVRDFYKKLPMPLTFPLKISKQLLMHEFKKFGLFGNYLSEWVHCTYFTGECNKVIPFVTLPKRMTDDYLEVNLFSFKKNPGIDQSSLYFLYLLSKPEYSGLFLYQRDAKDIPTLDVPTKLANLEQTTKALVLQKTTPSLACNNAVSDYIKEPISWERLGMDSYIPQGSWLPWIHPWIAQNIGRSMHEQPMVWELAKMTPVFGTALSILDGALTLYDGKDINGNVANRGLTSALLALDVVGGAFDVVGTAAVVNRYVDLGAQFKNMSTQLRLNKSADFAIEALSRASWKLREKLKFVNSKILHGAAICTPNPGMGMLRDDYVFGYASSSYSGFKNMKNTCMIASMYKTVVDKGSEVSQAVINYVQGARFYPDTNSINVGYYYAAVEYAMKDKGSKYKNTKEYFEDFIRFLRDKGKDDHEIERIWISGASDEETVAAYEFSIKGQNLKMKAFITPQNVHEIDNYRRVVEQIYTPFQKVYDPIVTDTVRHIDDKDPLLRTLKDANIGLTFDVKTGKIHGMDGANEYGDPRWLTEVKLAPRHNQGAAPSEHLMNTPLAITEDYATSVGIANINLGLNPNVLNLDRKSIVEYYVSRVLKPSANSVIAWRRATQEGRQARLGFPIVLSKEKLNKALPTVGGVPYADYYRLDGFENLQIRLMTRPNQCVHLEIPEVREAWPIMAKAHPTFKQTLGN